MPDEQDEPRPRGQQSVYETAESKRLAKLRKAVSRYRVGVEDANEELGRKDKQIGKLTRELEEMRSKADSSAMGRRIKELESMQRMRTHQDKFTELCLMEGIDSAAIGYLFQLSGWKADRDEIDEDAMTVVIQDLKAKPGLSKLCEPLANGEPQPPPKPPPKPGPGSGQGPQVTVIGDFTPEQKNDPAFVMKNYDRMVQIARDKIARGEA